MLEESPGGSTDSDFGGSEMKLSVGQAAPEDFFEAEEFARRRGWSEEALAKALRASRVFCFEVEGLLVYPAFFVDPRYDVRQLESVCRRLGALPGGSKWQFFVTRKGSLGGLTPLEALLAGDFAAVIRSAEGFRDR
jgi:hypothetical protein